MDTRVPSDDEIEAVLHGELPAGRSDVAALAAAITVLRQEVPAHAPAPSAELSAWLTGTSLVYADQPHHQAPVTASWHRRGLRWIAGLGVGAQAVLAGTAAAVAVGTAGVAGVLPEEAQQVFDGVLHREGRPAAKPQPAGPDETPPPKRPAPLPPPLNTPSTGTEEESQQGRQRREQDGSATSERPEGTTARGEAPGGNLKAGSPTPRGEDETSAGGQKRGKGADFGPEEEPEEEYEDEAEDSDPQGQTATEADAETEEEAETEPQEQGESAGESSRADSRPASGSTPSFDADAAPNE